MSRTTVGTGLPARASEEGGEEEEGEEERKRLAWAVYLYYVRALGSVFS